MIGRGKYPGTVARACWACYSDRAEDFAGFFLTSLWPSLSLLSFLPVPPWGLFLSFLFLSSSLWSPSTSQEPALHSFRHLQAQGFRSRPIPRRLDFLQSYRLTMFATTSRVVLVLQLSSLFLGLVQGTPIAARRHSSTEILRRQQVLLDAPTTFTTTDTIQV